MSLRLLLLLLAFLCLSGLAFAYLLISRMQDARRRRERRVGAVLRLHGVAVDAPAGLLRTHAAARRTPAQRVAGFLGADPRRSALYHVPWWLVPVLAVAPSCVVLMAAEFLAGSVVWLGAPLVLLFITRRYFRGRHARRIATLFAQFPEALATVVRAVRVGIPISEAIRAVAQEGAEPTRSEFARLAADVAIGSPLDEALRAMAERNHVPEYRFFATALSLQSQTGGAISETLENLADVIRKRVAARARGRALASEARTSAMVLSILPVVALVGLYFINPDYISVLFTHPTGHTILAAAAMLLGLGTLVMRTMIQKSLS